jgi:hypothetical protein
MSTNDIPYRNKRTPKARMSGYGATRFSVQFISTNMTVVRAERHKWKETYGQSLGLNGISELHNEVPENGPKYNQQTDASIQGTLILLFCGRWQNADRIVLCFSKHSRVTQAS